MMTVVRLACKPAAAALRPRWTRMPVIEAAGVFSASPPLLNLAIAILQCAVPDKTPPVELGGDLSAPQARNFSRRAFESSVFHAKSYISGCNTCGERGAARTFYLAVRRSGQKHTTCGAWRRSQRAAGGIFLRRAFQLRDFSCQTVHLWMQSIVNDTRGERALSFDELSFFFTTILLFQEFPFLSNSLQTPL